MRHPNETQLALFAGGDLGRFSTYVVRRHLENCEGCRQSVAGFQTGMDHVSHLAADLPPKLNWDRLSQEMGGNIRVGLAAGEAIAGFSRSRSLVRPAFRWNAGWLLAGASVVFTVGFWMNMPAPQTAHLLAALGQIRLGRVGKVVRTPAANADEVVLEASHSSIQVKENGSELSLLHPRSGEGVTLSVSMQGSAGARYVDSDTGQVTINRVYYAQQ